jgi:hypothetical protein
MIFIMSRNYRESHENKNRYYLFIYWISTIFGYNKHRFGYTDLFVRVDFCSNKNQTI